MLYLIKSRPGTHAEKTARKGTTRVTRTGKAVTVKATTATVFKKDAKIPIGTPIYFKADADARARKGTIIGHQGKKYHVEGLRQGYVFKPVQHVLPREQVWTHEEHQARKAPPKSSKFETLSSTKRTIAVKESNRRAKVAQKRFDISEQEILTHPEVTGMMRRTLVKLASTNNIVPLARMHNGYVHSEVPEMNDLIGEYSTAMMNSLRLETSKAPQKDLDAFRDHLDGTKHNSRIFASITTAGRGAAIRYLKDRQKKLRELTDFQAAEEDPVMRRELAQHSVPAHQEDDLTATPEHLEMKIDQVLGKLNPLHADIIRRKFGLGPYEPQNNELLAEYLNTVGVMRPDGRQWSKNNTGQAVLEAMQALKHVEGIEKLKDFLKSVQEVITLRKSAGKTICVDFDGVIADYSQGFQGENVFGEPDPDAAPSLNELKQAGWKVIIHTTRADSPELRQYLDGNGIPYDEINHNSDQPDGTNEGKPMADCYLDDRALHFSNWKQAMKELNGMQKSICSVRLQRGIPGIIARLVKGHRCLIFDNELLAKSYSSDLMANHPGGKWITIKEGPLAGRHIFILPHKDGSASVLSGGGPAMRHKLLSPRQEKPTDQKEEAAKPAQNEAAGEDSKEDKQPEKKPELTDEKRQEVETARQERRDAIKEERKQMADIVRTHLGKEVEITPEEKAQIEKKVEKIADPRQKAAERMAETNMLRKDKDTTLHEVIKEAKKAIIDEEPTGQGQTTIAAVVKEHAEDLLNHYYKIQALQRENKELGKILRTGDDKKPVSESVKVEPLSKKDLEGIITDEKARDAELAAHYKLVAATRGYVDDNGNEKKVKGGEEIERNIRAGGYEALTGIVGELTGSSIVTKEQYDELGSKNAALLAHYYLRNSGHGDKAVAERLAKDIEQVGTQVAERALDKGAKFEQMAKQVREHGKGEDNIMSAAQALGAALKFQNKAYEAYGQAEGSLNQAAELAYAVAQGDGDIELHGSQDSLDRKRRKLKLQAGDVKIKKNEDGSHTMTIPSKNFEKIIGERPTSKTGGISGEGYTVDDIKNLRANSDDFSPTMLRDYTPAAKDGSTRKIVLKPEQQAAARLIAKQKRVYLNFEAGTGKSLAVIAAKAHIEDTTGKPTKTIICMPTKLMPNFADEVKKFSNYNAVIVDDENSAKRAAKYASDPNTIVIVNKEKFNFDKQAIKDAGFHMVVADEAHKITQREGRSGSMMSEGLEDVAADSPYYVSMSGTPTPNDLSELYWHAHVINPEKFSSQKEFMAKFGAAHKGEGLKDKISAFMNQELNDHVMTAKKRLDTNFTMHTHFAKLTPQQKAAYRDVSDQVRRKEISPLQRDQQLNDVLNSHDHAENGKFKEIKKIVDEHLKTKAPDEKVLFYAKNYGTVKQIEGFLQTHYPEHDVVHFTGRQKIGEIRDNKERFKQDPKVKFAIHTRAGVEGLNLQYDGNGGGATSAIAVASGEDSFAPLDQFFSRANRTGAKKDINAHLVLTDTPHDLGTQLRLHEKKAVGELIKAITKVREHTRKNKSGTVSMVKEHNENRHLTFATYAEAAAHIESQAKKHGGKLKYYSSDEYKALYPHVKALYESEKARRSSAEAGMMAKDTYPDGRMVPKEGHDVFMAVPGFMGTGTVIRGKVVAGRCGQLNVKITGTSSLLGGVSVPKKNQRLTPEWSVANDPWFEQRRKQREENEQAEKAAFEAVQAESKIKTTQSVKRALKGGEKPITDFSKIRIGDKLVTHYGGDRAEYDVTEIRRDKTGNIEEIMSYDLDENSSGPSLFGNPESYTDVTHKPMNAKPKTVEAEWHGGQVLRLKRIHDTFYADNSMSKSLVHEHTRRTKSGGVTTVREHQANLGDQLHQGLLSGKLGKRDFLKQRKQVKADLKAANSDLKEGMKSGNGARIKRAQEAIKEHTEKLGHYETVYKKHDFLTDAQKKQLQWFRDKQTKVMPDYDYFHEAMAKLGGINADEAHKQWGLSIKEYPALKNSRVLANPLKAKGGLHPDKMAETMAGYGFVRTDEHGKHDFRDFEDKLLRAAAGEKIHGDEYYNSKDAEDQYKEAEARHAQEAKHSTPKKSKLDDLMDFFDEVGFGKSLQDQLAAFFINGKHEAIEDLAKSLGY